MTNDQPFVPKKGPKHLQNTPKCASELFVSLTRMRWLCFKQQADTGWGMNGGASAFPVASPSLPPTSHHTALSTMFPQALLSYIIQYFQQTSVSNSVSTSLLSSKLELYFLGEKRAILGSTMLWLLPHAGKEKVGAGKMKKSAFFFFSKREKKKLYIKTVSASQWFLPGCGGNRATDQNGWRVPSCPEGEWESCADARRLGRCSSHQWGVPIKNDAGKLPEESSMIKIFYLSKEHQPGWKKKGGLASHLLPWFLSAFMYFSAFPDNGEKNNYAVIIHISTLFRCQTSGHCLHGEAGCHGCEMKLSSEVPAENQQQVESTELVSCLPPAFTFFWQRQG